ncbi:MAG: hypothetical protein ACRD2N_13430 [Vicinamibacterales bacterium]
MRNRRLLFAPGVVALLILLACAKAPDPAAGASAAPASQAGSRDQVIEHIVPRRDSVGAVPEKFEWTAVRGADRYSIGLWNEVDQMIFRQDDLESTTFAWPRENKLEMGTYFWSVTAWSKDRAIAGSGLAAFVINR